MTTLGAVHELSSCGFAFRHRENGHIFGSIRSIIFGRLLRPKDPEPAAQSGNINVPLLVGPDGTVYLFSNNQIFKITPDGIEASIAGIRGSPTFGPGTYTGDGGPATNATLGNVVPALALDAQSNLYLADLDNDVIRRIDTHGIITTVIGSGPNGSPPVPGSADGVPALSAVLLAPSCLATAPDGSIYIVDGGEEQGGGRLLRMTPDGIVRVVVQDDLRQYESGINPPNDVPLSQAYTMLLGDPAFGVGECAVANDGTVYIVDLGAIRAIRPDGTFSTVLGQGAPLSTQMETPPLNEGQLAIDSIPSARGVAVAPDGTLLFLDNYWHRIRRINGAGAVISVAGNGSMDIVGDPIPNNTLSTQVDTPYGFVVDPDGTIVFENIGAATSQNAYLARIQPAISGTTTETFEIADNDGKTLFEFDNQGRHVATVDTFTGATLYAFAYDTSGRLSTVTDVDGNATTITRDGSGNPTAIVSPYGQSTVLSTDNNGYLARIQDPAGNAFAYSYTAGGLLQTTTTPRGGVYSYTYDAAGRLLQDVDPAGGGATLSDVQTSDATGNIVTRKTAMGVSSTYLVDQTASTGETQSATGPDGLVTSMTRSNIGTVLSSNPDGTTIATTLASDPRFGAAAQVAASVTRTTPSGLTSTAANARTVALSDPSNLLSIQTATETNTLNGNTWTRTFNAATSTWTTTSPAGRTITTVVDSADRPTMISTPKVTPLSFLYDAHGRLATMVQGARTWSKAYDANGYLTGTTDPMGRTTAFDNDAVGRAVQTELPDGRILTATYDPDSNQTGLTLPTNVTHAFSYTPVDLVSSYAPPQLSGGATTTQYFYDLDRRATSVVRPDGITIGYGYDSSGRLTTTSIPQGMLTQSYDPNTGYVGAVTAAGGERAAFAYDGFLPTGITWTGMVPGTLSVGYDSSFRMASQTLNGNALTFGYDADSLLTRAGALTLARDTQNGRITGSTLGNVTDSYGYDTNGFLAGYTSGVSGSPLYVETIVSRDLDSRITQKTDSATVAGVTTTHNWAYQYDVAGRLTQATEDSGTPSVYGYDGDDNRTISSVPSGSVSGTYDAQDRLLTYGQANYAYTANGELSSKTVGSQVTSYSYDALGNLLQVEFSSGLPDGTTAVDYVVDGQNRRVGRMVNGTLVQGWLYQDRLRPVAQLDGSSNLTARFVYGTKANVPDFMTTFANGSAAGTYRILSDHLGSPRLVVDVNSGNVIETINYDEFGNESDTLASSLPTGYQRLPFGFAGGLYDPDTTLVRFGARDYDASVGRWTSKDPIRFGGRQINLYVYVGNDPVNRRDVRGKGPLSCMACAALSSGAYAACGLAEPELGPGAVDVCTEALNFAGASPDDACREACEPDPNPPPQPSPGPGPTCPAGPGNDFYPGLGDPYPCDPSIASCLPNAQYY
jgi:RHS repeat-associated protein